MNSRPIDSLSDEPDDPSVLTSHIRGGLFKLLSAAHQMEDAT